MTDESPTLAWEGLHSHLCTVDGCTEVIRYNKLCKAHYQRHLEGIALGARRKVSRSGPCLVGGCERPRRSRGLCGPHYKRGRLRTVCPVCGDSMEPSSSTCDQCYRAAIEAQQRADKTCSQCSRTLPINNFSVRQSEGAVKRRAQCKECERQASRLRAKNVQRGDRSREQLSFPYRGLRRYAKKLGIPWAQIVERYPADNRCELCGRTPEEALPDGKVIRLSLDHCHETGRLRGFLCGPCNSGLGHLGDTIQHLQSALQYLRRASLYPDPPLGEKHD